MTVTKTFRLHVVAHAGLREAGITTREAELVVQAPSQKAALEAIHGAGFPFVSLHYLRDYGGRTHNESHVAVAARDPGAVFAVNDHGGDREFAVKVTPEEPR